MTIFSLSFFFKLINNPYSQSRNFTATRTHFRENPGENGPFLNPGIFDIRLCFIYIVTYIHVYEYKVENIQDK